MDRIGVGVLVGITYVRGVRNYMAMAEYMRLSWSTSCCWQQTKVCWTS
uniref:Uncharacterized protein n=1 Tax=Arundo donax TaxID=35708 RepID=A0A0A9GLB8_ARUDO